MMIFGTRFGIPAAAKQPVSHVNANAVMIIDITSENNIPDIEAVTVKPGWLNIKQRNRTVVPPPGQNTKPLLFLYDTPGKIIYKTVFDYPLAKTVPPRLAGSKDQASPDVIPIQNREVSLLVPYFNGIISIAIYNPGESIPKTIKEFDKLEIHYETCNDIEGDTLPVDAEEEKLHVLIIASGYTTADIDIFADKAAALRNYLLAFEPFKTYSPLIEVHIYENLANLGCYSGCSGIARLMCCHGGVVISAAVNSGYPFDEIIVLHNTDTYSGGGYRDNWGSYKTNSYSSYAMVYSGSLYKEMAVHELGHSFGNLCDEYTYTSEGNNYYPCVNCRENCSVWSWLSSTCQLSCDARNDYYRPGDSIMLALSIPYFNPVSIYSIVEPHGLERRLMYFTGQENQVFLSIRAERNEENAWLIRKHYGKIDITVDNPDSIPVSTFIVYRDSGEGQQLIKEFSPSDLQNGSFSFFDEYLEKDMNYTYIVEALNPDRKVVGSSNESDI